MNFFNSINAKWIQGQQSQQSQQNQNGTTSDAVYESMGNDMKQVMQKSKEKRSNNNGESTTPKWIQNIQQKCCPCFSAKYTILGINTSNLGIPSSTGIGTSRSLDDTVNQSILAVQSLGSMIGMTGTVRDNVYMIGICTIVYIGMALFCTCYLLDVTGGAYYAGIAYPNYLYCKDLWSNGIDQNYVEENNNNNNNTEVVTNEKQTKPQSSSSLVSSSQQQQQQNDSNRSNNSNKNNNNGDFSKSLGAPQQQQQSPQSLPAISHNIDNNNYVEQYDVEGAATAQQQQKQSLNNEQPKKKKWGGLFRKK